MYIHGLINRFQKHNFFIVNLHPTHITTHKRLLNNFVDLFDFYIYNLNIVKY